MVNYNELIDELLQGETPKEKYDFLVHLLNELSELRNKLENNHNNWKNLDEN